MGHISFDPCSNKYSLLNAKMEVMLPDDGLSIEWKYETIYVNPPYGKFGQYSISDWLEKCSYAHENYSAEVLALIPVATNTKHWKENIFKRANGICFLEDTRLKFYVNGKESKKGAPMACAMVYWGENYDLFLLVFSEFGKVFRFP